MEIFVTLCLDVVRMKNNCHGVEKYAAYYVGCDNNYVSLITTDSSDFMGNINKITSLILGVSIVGNYLFLNSCSINQQTYFYAIEEHRRMCTAVSRW